MILVTLTAIGVTWWMGQSSGKSGGGLSAKQRFTARPGTTRPNAMALTSDKRPGGVDSIDPGDKPSGEKDAPGIRSLSRQDGPSETATVERLVREAIEEAEPEDAIKMLEDALERGLNPDAAWRIHLALGTLYGRLTPPDEENAARAFAAARAAADTTAARQQIALDEASALVDAGQREEAWTVLATALAQTPSAGEEVSPEVTLLTVRMGDVLQETGNAAGAERAYRQALDRALEKRGDTTEAFTEALRLAATRLTLLLRGAGRHEEADALGRQVQARFRAASSSGN